MDISTLENERRRAIQQQGDLRMGVSGGWNVAGKNMISSPYAPFEPFDDGYDDPEDYRGQPVFGVEEDGQMFFDFPFVQAPNDMMLAHHTGGKHFTEPSIDELIQGLIDGQVPAGTLGDPETEQRMIEEYQKTKQNKLVSWVKNVGDELTPQEIGDGLRIIDSTETNPLKKLLRLDRMMRNNPPRV